MSETSETPSAESVFDAVPDDTGPTPISVPPEAADELAAALQEAAKNRDAYLRTMADFENYRRRVVRERDDARTHAIGGLLEDFFPIIDSLAMAAESARSATDVATIAKGVAIVSGQFTEVLSKHGVDRIDPVGCTFDPHNHEAVAHVPSGEVAEGHIIQVIRPGYRIGKKLVRAASVVVSSPGVPGKSES